MASGQRVGTILSVNVPATLGPQLTVRAGGSTPAERTRCYGFDASTIEYLDFEVELLGYAGGGLTIIIPWMAASATSNNARLRAAIRRIQDDAEDLDTSHTYDYNVVDATCASATGEVQYTSITFTDGADMDSWANGERAILRVSREANHANDNMAGDAQLLLPSILET